MKKVVHILKQFATLFVCTLLLLSCTKDDSMVCLKEVRVYFSFSEEVDKATQVDRMHLYLFDRNKRFVKEYIDDNILNFGTDYYISCKDIRAGSYRFIAWGGSDERDYTTTPNEFVKGQTTFDEALLSLNHTGGVVATQPHPLFHSSIQANVLINEKIQLFYMPLTQLTNTINITTVGLPTDANSYRFEIADNNCSYKFDKAFASHNHGIFTYKAACSKDGSGQLHSSLRVMRLAADRYTPQLQIVNAADGAILYPFGTQSGDLIGLILKALPQNNFETTHTYDIVLTFTGDSSTGFDVAITVNGWKVIDEPNDLVE